MSLDRARGALHGLAVGDALGMPTQSLPRSVIVARYGPLVERFEPGPPDHPLAAGLRAGTVTDDTEQAVLLGRLLVAGGGRIDPRELGRRLLAWEDDLRARGSLDLLGPSTRRAVAALAGGADPVEAGREGTTNGAAMRIAPVGIATPVGEGLIDRVVAASLATHGTGVALAGAAAVAAAVSAGIDGASVRETFAVAADAATAAAGRGRWVAAADVGARIRWATGLVAGAADPVTLIAELIGTSLATQESVPAAFAVLAVAGDDPWLACRLGASVGGDCDTIAAMAGAIAGACCGVDALPVRARVEHLDLDGLAGALLALRGSGAAAPPPAPRESVADSRELRGQARELRGQARGRGRLISAGNVVVDALAAVPELPERGGDAWASDVGLAAGGGFNAMAAAARQGVPVSYGGAHGTGPLGDLARTALAAEGIDVLLPPRPGCDTGLVIGIVDGVGERTFVSGRGAEATLDGDDLAHVRPEAGDTVLVSGYGLTAALVAWVTALPAGVTVALDPGPLAPPALLAAALPRVDWLTVNAAEAATLAVEVGIGPGVARPDDPAGAGPESLARVLVDGTGVRRGVLVRLGPAGCVLATGGNEPVVVPAVPVTAVDTTGAGDTHTGVFLARILLGDDPLTAARTANAAAALSVTRRGPATAPTIAELRAARPSNR